MALASSSVGGEGIDMPGLLSMDPTAAGLMALGGNMVRGDFGGGLLGFNQAIQGAQEANMRGQLGQAQIADMQQQIELRKQQAAQLERRNSLINNWLTGTNPVVGAPGSGMSSTGPNGAPMPGPAGGGMLGGVPQDALMADLAFNDGKNIGQWSYDRNKPNIEFINGVAVDKNRVLPGASLPQMSPTGQGYQIMPDPSAPGGFRVIMPQGADQVYGRFKAIDAGVNAQMTPEKVVSPDGSERYVTRAQVLSAAQGGPTASAGADADRYAILTQELAKAQASGNAGDVAAIQREIARLPAAARTGVSPSGLATGPFQASPTTQQAAQAAAEKERQTQITKDITEQRKSIMNADFSAPTNIAKMQKIGQLLSDVDGGKYTPTGTELASALNSLGIKIDKNLGNKQAAAAMANEMALQLRSPQGGAGMPGALSDKDREFLASMTPNQAQSLEGRNQVINAYVAVQKRNQQVAQFLRNYEKKYGKLDNGFFDQMAAWSAAHPLFGGK